MNTAASRTSSPSSSHPVQDTDSSAAPPSPAISRQISTLQQATDTQPGGEASPQLTRPQTGRLSAGVFQSLKAGDSERYPEMMSALRNIGKQRDTFNKLEARVAALEEAKVEQSELTHIRELITHKGNITWAQWTEVPDLSAAYCSRFDQINLESVTSLTCTNFLISYSTFRFAGSVE